MTTWWTARSLWEARSCSIGIARRQRSDHVIENDQVINITIIEVELESASYRCEGGFVAWEADGGYSYSGEPWAGCPGGSPRRPRLGCGRNDQCPSGGQPQGGCVGGRAVGNALANERAEEKAVSVGVVGVITLVSVVVRVGVGVV